jgi:hypothetical protein
MKTEQNCMDYEAPQVEIVEVEVEQGFYLSDLGNGGDYNS